MRLILLLAVLLLPLTTYAQSNNDRKNLPSEFKPYIQKIDEANMQQDAEMAVEAYGELFKIYDEVVDRIEGEKSRENLREYKVFLTIDYAQMLNFAGHYGEAIEQLLTGLEFVEENPHVPNADMLSAHSFMYLGMIYFFIEEYDNALLYYSRAEDLAEKIGSSDGIAVAKNNIANVYQMRKDYPLAISLYQESLALEGVTDPSTECNTLFNLGTCYAEMDSTAIALDYLQRAYDFAIEIGDYETQVLSQIELGILNEDAKQIENSIDIVSEIGHRVLELKAYQSLAKLKAEEKNFEDAFKYSELGAALSDSIFQAENTKQLNDFSVKYQEKEREAQLKLTRTIFYFVVGFLVVGLVLLYFIIMIQRRSNARLRELGRLKDKFVGVVSHDIKNPLLTQTRILELIEQSIENLTPVEIMELNRQLLTSSRSLLELLTNLLNWSKLEANSMSFNPINVDLRSIVKDSEELFCTSLRQKSISLIIEVPQGAIAYGDYNMVSTVLRNLLSNAIKYSKVGGAINIIANKQADVWMLSVKDYGVGMSSEVQESLFKLTAVRSQLGTAQEVGTGLGLIITKEMIERNGGELSVQSAYDKGTTISFTIPQKR